MQPVPDAEGYVTVKWPSRSVPHGGIFHPRKTEYSPETEKFLKLLLAESKLTTEQRARAWGLRDGAPAVRSARPAPRAEPWLYRPRTSRRRSLSAIREQGAFERDTWRPLQRVEDRELLKRRLQEAMECGGRGPPRAARPPPLPPAPPRLPSDEEKLDDLLDQIRERAEWLSEMEALGEGAKHRDLIRDQIAARVREIERLRPGNDKTHLLGPKTHKEDHERASITGPRTPVATSRSAENNNRGDAEDMDCRLSIASRSSVDSSRFGIDGEEQAPRKVYPGRRSGLNCRRQKKTEENVAQLDEVLIAKKIVTSNRNSARESLQSVK